jgi:hypothetical protein
MKITAAVLTTAMLTSGFVLSASAQDCREECKQVRPGQPYYKWKCGTYPNGGQYPYQTGEKCEVDLRSPITGTWKMTLSCPDGEGDLTWHIKAVSATSLSAREETNQSTFNGSIAGNNIAWKEHLPQSCNVINGVKECTPAWDRTYKLKLAESRLVGTMLFVELGGPDPRRHTCNIKGTRL